MLVSDRAIETPHQMIRWSNSSQVVCQCMFSYTALFGAVRTVGCAFSGLGRLFKEAWVLVQTAAVPNDTCKTPTP